MRAARLVHMLLLLQARERVTASEMAAALEVSVRTVHRDIEALSSAGVPVYAERGARGGFRLLGARRFALAGLTGAEPEAVRWVGVPAVARALGLESERQAAELKLLDALPAEAQASAQAGAEQILVDLGEAADAQLVRALRRAIAGRGTVHVRVRGQGSMRSLAPLGLVWADGGWHLVARELSGGALTATTLDAFEVVRVTREPTTRPPGFELASAWRWLREQRTPQPSP